MGDTSDDPSVEFDTERLEDAEAQVAGLEASYENWTKDDLKRAEQRLEAARVMPAGRQPQSKEISRIAHDTKGMGTTFGYDLVTLICASLCDFIRHIPDATDTELNVIDHHLAAATLVLDRRIKGPGGTFADKISAKLGHLTTTARDSATPSETDGPDKPGAR